MSVYLCFFLMSRTRISEGPLSGTAPGTISKLGKGTTLQRWQTWGGGEMGRVGDRVGVIGVDGSENDNCMVARGGGSGSDFEVEACRGLHTGVVW